MSDVQPDPQSDPKNTAAYKAAKLAVIILSVLIILALIALVVGGIWKLSGRGAKTARSAAPVAEGVFTLPPGAQIVSTDSQPGRLILRVRTPEGEQINIIDTRDGHLISQIKAMAAP